MSGISMLSLILCLVDSKEIDQFRSGYGCGIVTEIKIRKIDISGGGGGGVRDPDLLQEGCQLLTGHDFEDVIPKIPTLPCE